ncbi:MAG: nitroreductase family protein [Candidatus Bathyarchaeia archaeon]|jgi:nitroreductase
MNVFEAVQARRSIRTYLDKPVPQEKIERLLDAARLAPSARNTEPWHFITVTDLEKRKALSKGLYAKFVAEAPLVIVACGNKKASSDWYMVDTAFAVENLILAAVSEGLGTCCVGSFNEKEVAELLKVPDDFEVLLLVTVGYPKEKFDLTGKLTQLIRPRKLLSEVVSVEEFGNKLVPQKLVDFSD